MNCFGACNCKELKGWVTERSIVHAWKACVPKGTRGSNPLPSVLLRIKRFAGLLLRFRPRVGNEASLVELPKKDALLRR
jgi:hypothetical protein